MLNRERNYIVAEVFLVVKENNNGKDSCKKSTKEKRQDKKTSAIRVSISLNQQFIWARHFLRKRYSFFLQQCILPLNLKFIIHK